MNREPAGFRLGRIFGIDIFITFGFICVFVFIIGLWSAGKNPFCPALGQKPFFFRTGYLALLWAVVYVTLLFHEIGHSMVANKLGMPVKKITLFLLGGVAHIEKKPEKAGQELKMSIAGPVVSVLAAAVFFGAFALVRRYSTAIFLGEFFFAVAYVNVFIAGFNLLPAFPMDGGRILRALIWKFKKDVLKATKIAVGVSRIFSVAMCLFAFMGYVSFWFVIIAFFLFQASGEEIRSLKEKED